MIRMTFGGRSAAVAWTARAMGRSVGGRLGCRRVNARRHLRNPRRRRPPGSVPSQRRPTTTGRKPSHEHLVPHRAGPPHVRCGIVGLRRSRPPTHPGGRRPHPAAAGEPGLQRELRDLLQLGAALLHLRRPDDAVRALRRALELQPDFAQAHSNLAHVLGAALLVGCSGPAPSSDGMGPPGGVRQFVSLPENWAFAFQAEPVMKEGTTLTSRSVHLLLAKTSISLFV